MNSAILWMHEHVEELTGIVGFLLIAVVIMCSSGCRSEFTGATVTVGEQMALPQVTDASDSIAINVYESIKGARVYSRKDSHITVNYRNSYTNSYFGIVKTQDNMDLTVDIEPLDCGDAEK